MKTHNPRIVCRDGFSISVQANSGAYCSPRSDNGPYHEYECGYPSNVPLSQRFREYSDAANCGKGYPKDEEYTETVYPYVPAYLVRHELDLHGGIVEGRLPE
jgi:hypothetical protein